MFIVTFKILITPAKQLLRIKTEHTFNRPEEIKEAETQPCLLEVLQVKILQKMDQDMPTGLNEELVPTQIIVLG